MAVETAGCWNNLVGEKLWVGASLPQMALTGGRKHKKISGKTGVQIFKHRKSRKQQEK